MISAKGDALALRDPLHEEALYSMDSKGCVGQGCEGAETRAPHLLDSNLGSEARGGGAENLFAITKGVPGLLGICRDKAARRRLDNGDCGGRGRHVTKRLNGRLSRYAAHAPENSQWCACVNVPVLPPWRA